MPSRRYYIAIAPVEHINGKMAPQWQKCPNTEDPEHTTVPGFWYGYKHKSQPGISRYGVRMNCRNLQDHPYTAAEDENRTLFTISLHTVYEHKAIPLDWRIMMNHFNLQRRYTTPIGFAVAGCRKNNGQWPTEWSSG